MVKAFKPFDREAQRTVYIKTERFNEILQDAGAPVRVVPRNVEVHNMYEAYLRTCDDTGEDPMPKPEYEAKYICAACSFENQVNAPAEASISKALGVKAIKVRYADDYYGRKTDDELEVRYHAM